MERERRSKRNRQRRKEKKNRELTRIVQNPPRDCFAKSSVLCRRLVYAMGRGGVRIYTRGGT